MTAPTPGELDIEDRAIALGSAVPSLKPVHIAILAGLDIEQRNSSYEEYYLSFKSIASVSEVPLKDVRRNVRFLARKGLTRFQSGLWNDEGEPCGSGYGITKAGKEALAAQSSKSETQSSGPTNTPVNRER